LAAWKGKLEHLHEIWKWAEKKLATEEVNNALLFSTEIYRRTAWDWAAYSGKLEELHKIWVFVEAKLRTEEINSKSLLGTDHEGSTI